MEFPFYEGITPPPPFLDFGFWSFLKCTLDLVTQLHGFNISKQLYFGLHPKHGGYFRLKGGVGDTLV